MPILSQFIVGGLTGTAAVREMLVVLNGDTQDEDAQHEDESPPLSGHFSSVITPNDNYHHYFHAMRQASGPANVDID